MNDETPPLLGEAIATIVIEVLLIVMLPVDGWAVLARAALFLAIIVIVPIVVFSLAVVIRRRLAESRSMSP